ncbi:MAG: hypothetical protein ACREYF_14425 [Gammaproteobacteria bacterium]
MSDVTWFHKAVIGACGGLCLSLLKLIDAQFYLDNFYSKQALVGYLTYLSFIIIGIFVAIFLCEHDALKEKTIRSSFVLGLLGPSILIAIVKQPGVIDEVGKGSLKDITRVGYVFISPAYAQPPDVSETATSTPSTRVPVKILKKEDVELSYKQAFWAAIGRSVPTQDYVYIVGVAENAAKAIETAEKINTISPDTAKGLNTQVLKPEGKNEYYITVGDLKTSKEALETKASAHAAAIDTLRGEPDETSKTAATLLLEGEVVSGDLLFK